MRIGFVVPYFYPAFEYGGTPRVAYELARSLVRRGHDVLVLTTDSAGRRRIRSDVIAEIRRDGLDGIRVDYYRNLSNALAYRQRLFFPPRLFLQIRKRLSDCNVLHIHEFRSLLTVAACRAAHADGIPYVIAPHGGLEHLGKRTLKSAFDALWGRDILNNAAAMCVVSRLEEQDARQIGIEQRKLYLLPSVIDTERFKVLPKPGQFASLYHLRERKRILFLGRLNWIKGVDVLVEAIALIRNQANIHLMIAGPDDGAESGLRALVKQKALDEKVTFCGFLNDAQKVQALVDSDVVVIPSRREGFPVTLLEALACGKPVVLSSMCDVSDWPSLRGSYLDFQSGNAADLAQQLSTVLSGYDQFCLPETREFVLSEFSADALARKAEVLYEQVLAGQRANALR